MTNEPKEAIEYLKESVLIYKNTIPIRSNAIETALNLIKQQERKILDYDEIIARLEEENTKKDKIINAMIEEYEYNDRINLKNFCDDEIRKDKCIQDCTICIKEYFAREAKK